MCTFSMRSPVHYLRNKHACWRGRVTSASRVSAHSPNLSIRQNHDNDCAQMSSCRNSKHFHLNIPPPFRRTRPSLSALTHTPLTSSVLNYVRCKNCVSIFRSRPYGQRVHYRNIFIPVWYSFSVTCDVFCFIFFIWPLHSRTCV